MSSCDCGRCEEWRIRERKIAYEYNIAKQNLTFKRILGSVMIWLTMARAFEAGYLKG